MLSPVDRHLPSTRRPAVGLTRLLARAGGSLLFLGACLTLFLEAPSAQAAPTAPPPADGWFVLRLAPEVSVGADGLPSDASLRELALRFGIVRYQPLSPPTARRRNPEAFRRLQLDRVFKALLRTPRADLTPLLQAHRAQPAIREAWLDQRMVLAALPNDPYLNQQWGLSNDGRYSRDGVAGADIDALLAWDTEVGGQGVLVAIIDSGINDEEKDIDDKLWWNPGEHKDGVDEDGNGYPDDLWGWNFAYGTNDPDDDLGHGTNVGGIIAAETDNEIGFSGVCWGCKVMAVKVIDANNWAYYTAVTEGVLYAVDNGADLMNLSLGGTASDSALEAALQYGLDNGVVATVSMMNEGTDTLYYPAAYEQVVAVGASNDADERAAPFTGTLGSGSCYGPHIDLIAPGDQIAGLGAWEGDYSWVWSGTSQAAPHVAGVLGLLLTLDENFTPDELRNYLFLSAEDQVGDPAEDVSGWDIYYGHGRLNAAQALALAASDVGPGDLDGDGYTVGHGDCDDTDAAVNPGVEETCNATDDDCDGRMDEEGERFLPDNDGDGFGEKGGLALKTCQPPEGYVLDDNDCDDEDPAVNPGADEVCGNNLDDNCDGMEDREDEACGCGCAQAGSRGTGGLSLLMSLSLGLWGWRRRSSRPEVPASR